MPETQARNRGAFWFFLSGTMASLAVLLVLTVDTHRQIGALTHAERLSDQVVAGKRVFEKYNCNDCHTILGVGGYYAPDLTKAHWRLGGLGVKQVVLHPEVAFAASFRKMPVLKVSDQEADDLESFLEWVSNIDTHDWPPQDRKFAPPGVRRLELSGLSKGAALFKEKGCLGCHSLGGTGGTVGPALDAVGSRLDSTTITQQILDPKARNPNALMPSLGLSPDDAGALAAFLAKQTPQTQ